MLFHTNLLEKAFPKTNIKKELSISQIMTDSRKQLPHSFFVPIVGEQFDGHQFLHNAIENGAIATFWQADKPLPDSIPADFVIYYVKDTLLALQELATIYLEAVQPFVIGVTGSNGKTTTKDLLYAVMKEKYVTHCTAGNFNNHIGLPLTILQMPQNTEVVILEMGMNHFGEIELLANIARPNIAIITNIGESHIEHLGSREGIAQAKLEIISQFRTDGKLIVDGDEPLLNNVAVDTIRCGFGGNNDVVISNVDVKQDRTEFMLQLNERYTIPLIGKHHAKNASYAIMVGQLLGMTAEEMNRGLASIQSSGMRFELMTGKHGVQLINDAYNASPTSMKGAIEVVKALPSYQTKIIVLGDILELGEYSESYHRSIAEVISKPIDLVYTYGEQAYFITKQLKENKIDVVTEHFQTKELLIKALLERLNHETVILFKASRAMAFESIVEACLDENE